MSDSTTRLRYLNILPQPAPPTATTAAPAPDKSAGGADSSARFRRLLATQKALRQAGDDQIDADAETEIGAHGVKAVEIEGEVDPETLLQLAPNELPPPHTPPKFAPPRQPLSFTGNAARTASTPSKAAPQDLVESLTQKVSEFCNAASGAAQKDWMMTIRLDPKMIADTTLHLSISGLSLSLRFQSPNSGSRALLCGNSDALVTRLETRVNRKVTLDVVA